MDQTRSVTLLFLISALFHGCSFDGITVINPIRYPPGSPFIALFAGFALPVEIDKDLSMAIGFQVAYDLPTSDKDKELTYPPIISKRSLERYNVYKTFEKRLERHGYAGKACLLRAICEASERTFEKNGVLADIVHILFTPSTSNEESGREYSDAENYGKARGHCRKYEKKCDISVIGLISVVNDSFVGAQ